MFAPRAPDYRDGEKVDLPDFGGENAYMAPAEAEKALRELMGGAMNQDLDEVTEIDRSEATVQGFKEGIKLLDHQIIGRKWMRDREDVSLKRTGGILADDMGWAIFYIVIFSLLLNFNSLGKTIQTLTRIVEGKAKQRDKEDGYSASTLYVVFQIFLSHLDIYNTLNQGGMSTCTGWTMGGRNH